MAGYGIENIKSFVKGAAVIKVSDALVIEEGVVLTQKCRLRIVVELIKSNDIRRPVNRLYPKEVCATEQLYRNIVKKN